MEVKKIIKITLYISIAVFIIAAFQKDKLPDKQDIFRQLYDEPLQTDTSAQPFQIEEKGIKYNIVPLYNYELYGLVVSYHHSKVFWDNDHRESRDFVNTCDICVIWGRNIETRIYKKMRFSSGCWTCYPNFSAGVKNEEWSKYSPSCLSNNHVLAGNSSINKQIMSVEKGDQIYIKGYLIKYTQADWGAFWRTSSTTRNDNGCEVIFVTDFKILRKANFFWRYLYRLAKYMIIICVGVLIVRFFKYPLYDN